MDTTTPTTHTLTISTTRRGFPAVWESGGGFTSTGSAIIVARADGGKPTAVYIPRGGHRACKEHALIPVRAGMYIIRASYWRAEGVWVYRILSTSVEDVDGREYRATAEAELVAELHGDGTWNPPCPPHLEKAVETARAKAHMYHCRSPLYVEPPNPKPLTPEQQRARAAADAAREAERAKLREAAAEREAAHRAEVQRAMQEADAYAVEHRIASADAIAEANSALAAAGLPPLDVGEFDWGFEPGGEWYTRHRFNANSREQIQNEVQERIRKALAERRCEAERVAAEQRQNS